MLLIKIVSEIKETFYYLFSGFINTSNRSNFISGNYLFFIVTIHDL